MNKGSGDTDVDPAIQMIILIGVVLVILNSFSNLFLYLKNEEESKKDSTARSIYQAQLCVLLLLILTLLFLFALGTGKEYVVGMLWYGSIQHHWWRIYGFFFILILVVGGILVNIGAETDSFLGLGNPDE